MRGHTREPQYQVCVELQQRQGLTPLGLMSSHTWHEDPKRLVFVLARYKFVAKMFRGFGRVLEIGCADAFGTRIVLQEVGTLTAVDFDPVFVDDVQQRMDPRWTFECAVHDLLDGPVPGEFDGVFALDVLEHIPAEHEDAFLRHACASLAADGALLIGTPSLESQAWASPPSRAGHVNCKSGAALERLLSRYFHRVFSFSMNDEVVHTGFQPMAHYLFALCCQRREVVGAQTPAPRPAVGGAGVGS
jgi:hypothetical protein